MIGANFLVKMLSLIKHDSWILLCVDHLGVAISFTTLEVKFLLDEALASDEFP